MIVNEDLVGATSVTEKGQMSVLKRMNSEMPYKDDDEPQTALVKIESLDTPVDTNTVKSPIARMRSKFD